MAAERTPFHVASLRGLGAVTSRELRHLFGDHISSLQSGKTRNLDVTRFGYEGPPGELLRIGTAEDVFATIDEVALTGAREDLALFTRLARRPEVTAAVDLARSLKRLRARVRFRVVVQATDADWRRYRREEVEAALLDGLARRQPKWRPVDEEADLEFWVQQIDRRALVGLRLSDATMRHRDYKVAHMPGSLRPTVARAMAFLAGWTADDVVVDPVCGAGTLLIERALLDRCGALLGGDLDGGAARAAMDNFGRRHRPRGVCRWDAGRLPVRDGSVHTVLANLPWGHRVPMGRDTLYGDVVRETERVLRPGGRAAFLTSEAGDLERALRIPVGLPERQRVRGVQVLGRRADIFVVDRA